MSESPKDAAANTSRQQSRRCFSSLPYRKARNQRSAGGRGPVLDFPTRLALILSAVTLVGMLILSTIYSTTNNNDIAPQPLQPQHRWLAANEEAASAAADDDTSDSGSSSTDYTSYSCNYIYEITPHAGSAQCAFARTCNQGDGVWAPSVFCSDRFSRQLLALLLSPVMALWLVLLFRLLGSTAEDYFSPALEMFSVKLGLPPRFAGVSLLALGNGAADVSATISAIAGDPVAGYKLALGALTGAAMLISGVISALVILTADGVPCRGALVRDVTALLVTVAAVWTQLGSGSVTPDSVTYFLAIYVGFVLLVLVADIYHRAVVLPRLAGQADRVELERQRSAAADMSLVAAEQQQALDPAALNVPTNVAAQPQRGWSAMLTALSNYDNVNPNDPTTANGTTDPQAGWGVESDDFARDRPIQLHGHGGILDHHRHHHLHHEAAAAPASIAQDPSNAYTPLEDEGGLDHTCVQLGSTGIPADSWMEALEDGRDELKRHAEGVWDDIVNDADVHVVSKFLLICELPFTAFRKLTVPIPCEGYYCRALIALSLAVSPLWFVFYLWRSHDMNLFAGSGWIYLLVLEALVGLGALCILRFAPGGEGEMALLFSTPIAFYGFVIAATWIDTIADALVSLLNFVGIILHIPGPVIGLTILAWGNSMGDLSANITMARKGLANMAMTACFAGPVFNILVGLGLGFSRQFAAMGTSETEVALSPSVITGFLFLAVNAAGILGVGLVLGSGTIPKQFGYLSLSIYTIYLVTSITLQYSKYGDE